MTSSTGLGDRSEVTGASGRPTLDIPRTPSAFSPQRCMVSLLASNDVLVCKTKLLHTDIPAYRVQPANAEMKHIAKHIAVFMLCAIGMILAIIGIAFIKGSEGLRKCVVRLYHLPPH
jgi:hypothetical protein